jgi:signal transduction histidine kinase
MIGLFVVAAGMALYYLWFVDTEFVASLTLDQRIEYKRLSESGNYGSSEFEAFEMQYGRASSLSQELTVLFALTVLSMAIAGVLGLALARRIAEPIADVAQTLRRLATYDLDARAKVHGWADAGQEIGMLVGDVNFLAATLQRDDLRLREQAATIAHEFRTPLTILAARLQGIQDGVIPADHWEISRLVDHIGGLTRIVEDLRMISIAEAGGLSLLQEAQDVGELVRKYAEDMQPHAMNSRVELEIKTQACRAYVDADRMRQILVNLLGNSIRYAGEGKHILVACEKTGDSIVITVRDDGSGIDPAILPVIFEPFTRSEKSRSRDGAGSGLGLAVVKALVEAQGGSVAAVNPASGGSLFRIILKALP